MQARKGLVIVLLISLIAAFFYWRPFLYGEKQDARVTDRLPMGDFIGKIQLLDLARETNPFLFYHKLPFREFLTIEFILSQSKSYGLDVQKPVYFFSNENEEWGTMVNVVDSSKVFAGILKLKQNLEIEDTLVGGQKVGKISKEKIYFTYGKNWLFMYHGNQMPKRMYQVWYSKRGDMHPGWKKFLALKNFSNESLVVSSSWKKIKKLGIEQAILTHDSDSSMVTLKTYFKSKSPLGFSLKEEGPALPTNPKIDKGLSFHFNIEEMRANPNAPLRLLLQEFSKRISFPIADFFAAWEGDISFQEGGKQKIKESYIETEYDEEFNPVDVVKQKDVEVPGYAVLLSMNQHQKKFISKLFAKGIMRKQDNKFFILTSPPLKINQNKNYLLLHSSGVGPKLTKNTLNGGYWTADRTRYEFVVDSLNTNEVSISVRFPGIVLVKKNKLI